MTDAFDEEMASIAVSSAENGGPGPSDILRALKAAHGVATSRGDAVDRQLCEFRKETHDQLGRIRSHLESESGRTRQYVDQAIAGCREVRAGQTAEAEGVAAALVERKHERRVMAHWLTDATKRLIVLATFVALSISTYFLITHHDVAAAQVTGILALVTPFILLLYRRS